MTAALLRANAAPGPSGRSPLNSFSTLWHNLRSFQRDPLRLFLELHHHYGDVVRLRLGPYPIYLVTHPDLVKYVLIENHRNYRRGKLYDNFKPFFGEGLLTTDGEVWRRHRRVVQPLFHRRTVEASLTAMTDATATMLDSWQTHAASGIDIDVIPDAMWLTLRILGKAMFSCDLSDRADIIGPAVQFGLRAIVLSGTLDEMIPHWIPTPYNRRLGRAQSALRTVVDDMIAERRRGGREFADVLGLMLASLEEGSGDGLSDREIHDEAMTIFLAGHETTGTGLAWAMYCISQHPEVRRKLEEEVDRVLGDRPPTLEDLSHLTYTRMVVDETLRLYPPIFLYPRDAIADDEIGGYHIPAGSSIFLLPYVTHRHPAFWENPAAFDPERFRPERAAERPRFAYFPFGGGQRQCIGMHMALLQIQIAVAMMAQRYRLHAVPGHPLICQPGASLRPIHGIRMVIHPRG